MKYTFLLRRQRWPIYVRRCSTSLNFRDNKIKNFNDITTFIGLNGKYQKIYEKEMLEREWIKGNTPLLFLGIHIDGITKESNIKGPLKIRMKLSYYPQYHYWSFT